MSPGHLDSSLCFIQPSASHDPLEKGKITHASILAWRIPWTVFLFLKLVSFTLPLPPTVNKITLETHNRFGLSHLKWRAPATVFRSLMEKRSLPA